MPTGRILVNMPSSQGAIGDVYNFRLEPSLTLGCGSWGGNATRVKCWSKTPFKYQVCSFKEKKHVMV